MVLAPEPRDAPVQFVDVRDLAEWMLGASERSVTTTPRSGLPPEVTMPVSDAVVCATSAVARETATSVTEHGTARALMDAPLSAMCRQ